MTLPIFPAVIPTDHPVIVFPRFPHVRRKSTGGSLAITGLAYAKLDAEIKLPYDNIDTDDLLALKAHWDNMRGIIRAFNLPAELFQSMDFGARSAIMATPWKFKEAPKITDTCGGLPNFLLHSLDVTLISQPIAA